jgi:hydroxypyruvate isomerase
MLRRTLVTLPVAAALASVAKAQKTGFKLSVRVEGMFPKLTLPQRIEKVAEAGYDGYEFGDWRSADSVEIVKLQRKLNLECVCLVGNKSVNPKGMGLCDPAERAGFLAEIKASVEAAKRYESKRLVVLTGNRIPGMTVEAQRASIIEGLKRGADIAAAGGIQLILEMLNTLAKVEPLNPLENHNNYYLNSTREAFDIVKAVGSDHLRVLFDFYHVQIMEGNLIESLRNNIAWIGHFHVGDVPGRHEPGTGEINYQSVFRAIRATGFKDYVAMEYVPLDDAVQGLKRVRALAAS